MNSIELGKLLKLARQQKELTQEQLAETLSVTTSAISKWENGKNLPDSDMLLKLALALELTIEDLFYPEQTTARITNKSSLSPNTVPTNTYKKFSKQTINNRYFRHIALLLFICLTFISVLGGILLHSYLEKKQELNITQIAYRITEDEVVGTVREVACLYSGDLENNNAFTSFFSLVRESWIYDTSVPQDIHYLKLSFYPTRDSAYAWDIPDKSVYVVR